MGDVSPNKLLRSRYNQYSYCSDRKHIHTHTCTHNTQIYRQTRDEHFELLIMDFESSDLDVEEVLRNSSLKR